MRHPNQEERRKEECQIFKDKQQVRKKKKIDTTKKEKLEQKNREEGMKRKIKKNKVQCSFNNLFVFFSRWVIRAR